MTRRLAFLAALLLALPVQAQEAPAGEEKKPVLEADQLAAQQAEVRKRLAKIEDTMQRIAKILAKQNPDEAARLRLAWQRSQADRNLKQIEEIENLLKERYFIEAYEQQKGLETALQRLLDILLDRDAERKEVEEKIEKYEQLKEKLNQLIQEERDQYLETEKFADPEKALQRAAAAKAKLQDLINRQKDLLDRTKNPERATAVPAFEERVAELLRRQKEMRGKENPTGQKDLAEDARKLAEDLAKHAESLPAGMRDGRLGRRNPGEQAAQAAARAAKSMEDAGAKMQEGAPFAPPQEAAEQDLREAAEALKRLDERMQRHGEKELKADQERIRKDAARLQKEIERLEKGAEGADGGSGDVGQAQKGMEGAEKQLGEGRRDQAAPQEEQAKRDLEKAAKKLEDLEQELKRLMKLPDYDKLADKQEKTEEKTDDLLKKMKQEQGQQPGADGEGEPTPGQQSVEGAKRAMQRAKQNLRGKSAKGANSDQKEAVERLEKAREELEEALRQLREEEQLMLLEAIERRLIRMLQGQTRLFKQTIALNIRLRDSKKPARADIDQARQLGEGESGLAVEADKLLEILQEEGTTVVIPDVVADLKGDLETLASRLRGLKAGAYTQQIQQDVIETLKELIEVVREELEKKQGGQGGGGEPMEGGQEDSLLPNSAELKMLKSLQLRVNRRTERFERLREKEDSERDRLSGKQKSVGDLTRTMADKLNRQEDG